MVFNGFLSITKAIKKLVQKKGWGMNVLGWRKLESGDYLLELPHLSDEEAAIILRTQELYKEAARNGKPDIFELLKIAAKECGLYLDIDQEDYLSDIARMQIEGYGFFDRLLSDGRIEEVSVIGPGNPVYVYLRNEGWKSTNVCLENEQAINEMINRMAKDIGRHITLQNPRLDAMLKDGSRLHGSLPPVSAGEITLRKFRDIPYSPVEISNVIPYDVLAFLSLLMQCDCSLMIAGNTASGKTTTLNALFSFVPQDERVIITEETPEISIPHEHQLRLVANKEMGIGLKDLVYDTLRMRPDRIIVGEVRNREEAEALFDVLMAGQARGSYATFHAQSVDEGLQRLRTFGIQESDIASIDCMVIQRRQMDYSKDRREIRKIIEIAEPGTGKRIYDGRMRPDGAILERIAESFDASEDEMKKEMKRRERMFRKCPRGFSDFFKFYQGEVL